jgi:hypothetical protein
VEKTDIYVFEDSRKDQQVVVLDLTQLRTRINYQTNGYGFKALLDDTKELCREDLLVNFKSIISVLKQNNMKNDVLKLSE